jgi:hypothetical protein
MRTTSVRRADTNRAMERSLLQLQRRNGLGRAATNPIATESRKRR